MNNSENIPAGIPNNQSEVKEMQTILTGILENLNDERMHKELAQINNKRNEEGRKTWENKRRLA